MSKPYIKLTTCEGGDWSILEASDSTGVIYEQSGHSISDSDWLGLISLLGYDTCEECISDEAMEALC